MKIQGDKFTKMLVSKAYPEYRGRKLFLTVSEKPINCASYWDGGSRSYFRFVNLATTEVSNPAPAQSAYDRKVEGLDAVQLPVGFACIEHCYFMGHESITIYIRPENAAKFLPASHAATVLP